MKDKILQDREERYNRILQLLNEYNLPVLCAKINYPGETKNTFHSDYAFQLLCRIIVEEFSVDSLYTVEMHGFDGKAYISVLNCDIYDVKKRTVNIENSHSLGRIFDIDVYNVNGEPVSRTDIGEKRRKCIICENDAKICVRLGKHTKSEIISKIDYMIDEYSKL